MTVENKMGIHARPAALFVQTANAFISEVRVSRDGVEVNGKSVMGLMMLAAHCGSKLTIKAWGSDETEAMQALKALFARRFQE